MNQAAKVVRRIGNPYRYQRKGKFEVGDAALIPQAYQKFWNEWNLPPTPLHYTPKAGEYIRHEETGIVKPVQDRPLTLQYPEEFDGMLLGGEAILKGFIQKKRQHRRPHFWMPSLVKLVVHSEIMNKHIQAVGTDRVIRLINHYQGFDEYILQTGANDLKSLLALKIKRDILKNIHDGCPAWKDDPEKQQDLLSKFKKYGDEYTPEEVEWYGHSFLEAIDRVRETREAEMLAAIKPLKHQFRKKLIEDLKTSGLETVERIMQTEKGEFVELPKEKQKSWVSKINPFAKK